MTPVDDYGPESPAEDATTQLDDVVTGALRGLFGRDSVYMMLWGVQLAAAALLTPLITRVLDAPDFGAVAAGTAVMQVVFVIAGLGLYQALQRKFAETGNGLEASKLLGVAIGAAICIIAVMDLTGPLWAVHVGFPSYAGPPRVAVLWAGVAAFTNSGLALLRSQDRLLAFGTVSLLQSVGATLTGVLLVVAVSDTGTWFLIGEAGTQAAAALLAVLLAKPSLPRRRDWAMVKEACAFALPLVPAALCTFVLSTSDRLIVQSHLGQTAVARYQLAYNLGSLPILLLSVLNQSWMPRIFAIRAVRERAAVLAASRDLLYRTLIPVLIGLAIGAPIVLRIWAPPAYAPDELLVVNAIVLVSAIPYAATQGSTRDLLAQGRTGRIAVAQGVAGIANVGLNFALIPHFGLAGSAAATFLAYSALLLTLRSASRGSSSVPRPPLRLVASLLITTIVALAVSAVPAESVILMRLVLVFVTLVWFLRVIVSGRRALGG